MAIFSVGLCAHAASYYNDAHRKMGRAARLIV
jgi:hypothetical protein